MPTCRTNTLREAAPADGRSAARGELPFSLHLRHAGPVQATLHYELVGCESGPLLIVAGGISAGRHVVASPEYPQSGWWQQQVGSIDLSCFRVLSMDWLGSDGTLDVPIDPADQADALANLLIALGLNRASAFIGASYGAMVGMHLAARHPSAVGALLAISGADRAHPFSSACRALQRQAVVLGEALGSPQSGVALARAMAILTYRTADEFAERFSGAPRVHNGQVRVDSQDYLDAQGTRHCRRMTAIAYRRLSESIDLHQVAPGDIQLPLTLVAVDGDALVPPADIRALADAAPHASFHLIHSHFGHDAFLKEGAAVGRIIADFLQSLELA